MTFVNAGHHPPLCAGNGGEIRSLEGTGNPPLGILRDIVYERSTVRLKDVRGLLLYTDGVTEARNASGETFGLECLTKRARGLLRGQEPRALIANIVEDVETFSAGTNRHDDITLLCLGVTES